MNAETLAFPEGIFDEVFLHRVLSVVERPQQALVEAVRILRSGGRCLILDKFAPVHRRLLGIRRFLNRWTPRLGTDMERSWDVGGESSCGEGAGRRRFCSGEVIGSFACGKWRKGAIDGASAAENFLKLLR